MEQRTIEEKLGVEEDLPLGTIFRGFGLYICPAILLALVVSPLATTNPNGILKLALGCVAMLGLALGSRPRAEKESREPETFVIDPTMYEGGLVTGVTPDRRYTTMETSEQPQHALLRANSGAGKSTTLWGSILWPKICKGAPVVMLDAKYDEQTLLKLVYCCRQAKSLHRLRYVDPDRKAVSHTMNVMWQGGTAVENIDLVTGLKPLGDNAGTQYYSQAQYDAISGIIWALHDSGFVYNLGDVQAALVSQEARQELINIKQSDGAKHLQMVLHDFQGREDRWMFELKGLVVILRKYLRAAGEILLVDEGEVNLHEILKTGGIFFMPLPTGQSPQMANAWARMMVKSLLAAWGRLIREGHKPQEPAVAAFEEFGNYCSQDAAFAFSWARAAHTMIVALFQDDAQLRTQGEGLAEIIKQNTYYKLMMRHGSIEGATAAAEQIGKHLVLRKAYSAGGSKGWSWGMRSSESTGESHNVRGSESEELIVRPEEFLGLGRGVTFVNWLNKYALMKAAMLDIPEDELIDVKQFLEGRPRVGYQFAKGKRRGIGLWQKYANRVEQEITGRYRTVRDRKEDLEQNHQEGLAA